MEQLELRQCWVAPHHHQHPITTSIPLPTASHRQRHPITNSIPSPTASHHHLYPITSSIPPLMASHRQRPHPPFPEGHGSSAAALPLPHVPLFALSSALSINLGVIYGDVLFIFFSLLRQAGLEGPHLFIEQ